MTARRGLRASAVALLWILVVAPPATAAMELPTELPPDSQALGPEERQALLDFQRDPVANGKALLRLGAGSARRLPLAIVLVAADAHLRAGRTRSAVRFFREVGRREPGAPWETFAHFGLGWAALARRDFAAAAKHYRSVGADDALAGIARVMLAWLPALEGRYPEALALFDRALADSGLPPPVRQVAMLGAAYTRYWMGSFEAAAVSFDRLVSPPSVLSDDARYGAAWSRLRAGGLDAALPALTALAAEVPADAPAARFSDAAVSLSPSSVLRSGRDATARISGLAGPDARLVATFDGDGAARARAALGVLVRRGEVSERELPADARPAVAPAAQVAAPSDPLPARRAATETVARPKVPVGPSSAAAGWTWRTAAWVAVGVLLLALVAAFVRSNEPRPKASKSGR